MITPAITVLMPVYNAGRYLREAIDSILAQTFRHFELLIIDDGSTDDSVSILSEYQDARIRFYSNEKNLGITATLNRGIDLSRAELIARMDADDISYPGRLQRQFGYMQQHPDCALLSTWAKVVGEDRKFVRLERYRSNFYYYNLTFECWIYHPTVMFRKSAVCKLGKYSKPYSEDYDLFWKISTHFKIGNIAEPLVEYRLSSTSLNTVLRKEEYDVANEQNVIRNIRYYMGDDFQISKTCLECLRHNFSPIVLSNNPDQVFEALFLLERITCKILERENINRDASSIGRAFYFKRKFILREVARALPGMRGVVLLLPANAWFILYGLTLHSLGWRMRRMVKMLV